MIGCFNRSSDKVRTESSYYVLSARCPKIGIVCIDSLAQRRTDTGHALLQDASSQKVCRTTTDKACKPPRFIFFVLTYNNISSDEKEPRCKVRLFLFWEVEYPAANHAEKEPRCKVRLFLFLRSGIPASDHAETGPEYDSPAVVSKVKIYTGAGLV